MKSAVDYFVFFVAFGIFSLYSLYGALNGSTFLVMCGKAGCMSSNANGLIAWILFVISMLPTTFLFLVWIDKGFKGGTWKIERFKTEVIVWSIIGIGLPIFAAALEGAKT